VAMLAKGIDLQYSIHRPLFRQLFRMGLSSEGAESAATMEQRLERDRAGILQHTTSEKQAGELVTRWFLTKIAQVLALDMSDIDTDKPVYSYGIDSLVAIDLKNWFAREINTEIQVFSFLGNTSIRQVAEEAAAKSSYRNLKTK
jgi:acyl carrier protein